MIDPGTLEGPTPLTLIYITIRPCKSPNSVDSVDQLVPSNFSHPLQPLAPMNFLHSVAFSISENTLACILPLAYTSLTGTSRSKSLFSPSIPVSNAVAPALRLLLSTPFPVASDQLQFFLWGSPGASCGLQTACSLLLLWKCEKFQLLIANRFGASLQVIVIVSSCHLGYVGGGVTTMNSVSLHAPCFVHIVPVTQDAGGRVNIQVFLH